MSKSNDAWSKSLFCSSEVPGEQGVQIGFGLFENGTETVIIVGLIIAETATKLRDFRAFRAFRHGGHPLSMIKSGSIGGKYV